MDSFFNNGNAAGQPVFAQFLKDSKDPKYTVAQINVYPTITYGVQVASTLAYAWLSDGVLGGARWGPIVFGGVRASYPSFLSPLFPPSHYRRDERKGEARKE